MYVSSLSRDSSLSHSTTNMPILSPLFTRLLPHPLSSVIVNYFFPSVLLGQIIFLCADNLVLGCHELTFKFCIPRINSLKRMIYIISWQAHLFSYLFMSFLFPNCTFFLLQWLSRKFTSRHQISYIITQFRSKEILFSQNSWQQRRLISRKILKASDVMTACGAFYWHIIISLFVKIQDSGL